MAVYTFNDIPEGSLTIGILVNVYANFTRALVMGIMDTGCSHTCISEELAEKMSLPSLGKVPYSVVGGVKQEVDCYEVNIMIDNTIPCGDIDAGSYHKGEDFYDVIIGMDILSKCDFAITSASGHMVLTMEYPSKRNLDFTKE